MPLDGDVEKEAGCGEPHDGRVAHAGQAEGDDAQRRHRPSRRATKTPIGQPARNRCGTRAGGADEREDADAGVREPVLLDELVGHRGPERAERAEEEHLDECPAPQDRLLTGEGDHRTQQHAVALRCRGLPVGQHPPQHQRGHDGGGRRDRVHRSPTGGLGDPAGHRPGEQDAQQETAHDAADHAASAFVRGQVGGERDEELRHAGGHPDGQRRDGEHGEAPRHQGQEQRAGAGQQEGDDETAVLEEISERDDEEDPDGVAELAGCDQERRRAPADVEVGGQQVQQRLRDVDGGGGQAARHRHRGGDGGQRSRRAGRR